MMTVMARKAKTNTLLAEEEGPHIGEKSDEEILALSIKKPDLFGVLLDRYQDAFLRKAQSVVISREEAEDVVQETFTKIYLNAHRFDVVPGATFKSWGYRILLNTSFTHYQRLKRIKGTHADLDPEFYELLPDLEHRQFEKQEMVEFVISILSRMPDQLGRVLKLHFLEGLPQQEIADMENTSVGAIKTRVHRAKKLFKEISAQLAR
jgi:RNA polymerase sigma-70 factor (ECF subfamily)